MEQVNRDDAAKVTRLTASSSQLSRSISINRPLNFMENFVDSTERAVEFQHGKCDQHLIFSKL